MPIVSSARIDGLPTPGVRLCCQAAVRKPVLSLKIWKVNYLDIQNRITLCADHTRWGLQYVIAMAEGWVSRPELFKNGEK